MKFTHTFEKTYSYELTIEIQKESDNEYLALIKRDTEGGLWEEHEVVSIHIEEDGYINIDACQSEEEYDAIDNAILKVLGRK
jgi:hypothetical protein